MDDEFSASNLQWAWAAAIEILAASPDVEESVLPDAIEKAPDIPDDLGKNMREMLAFRSLDRIFGSDDGNGNQGSSALDAKARIDPSKNCEEVLQDILHETSGSILNGNGLDLVKCDVKSFIMARKDSLPKVALQQLEDTLSQAPESYTTLLKEINGLEFPTSRDYCCMPERASKLPEGIGGGNLLPTKRHRAESGAEHPKEHHHESQNCIHDSDSADLHPNAKKVMQGASHDIQSGEGTYILQRREILDLSNRRDHITETQGCPLENDNIEISHADILRHTTNMHVAAPQKSPWTEVDRDGCNHHQLELHCPSNIMPQDAVSGDGLPPSNNVINGEDHVELDTEQRKPSDAPKDLQVISANNSQGNSECDFQVETEKTASPGRLPQENIGDKAKDDTEYYPDTEMSSDSDGYHNERFHISGKKHEFLSSQCTFSYDSLSNTELTEQTICIKCRKDGDLLVCKGENCIIALHEKCLGYPVTFDSKGDFYCPFCSCIIAIRDYRSSKKEASLARRILSAFICNRNEGVKVSGNSSLRAKKNNKSSNSCK